MQGGRVQPALKGQNTAKEEEQFFRSRGFSRRIGFGKHPAVLVVDFIQAFTNPRSPLGSDVDPAIAATRALLTHARAKRIPVIFSTLIYDPRLKEAGIWALKQRGLSTLIANGGDASKVDPRLEFRRGDGLLIKKYASCFFGTDLGPRLLTQSVDTLIIAGCTTSGCVRATAVDALQTGFRPMVVREAVGDRSPRAHNQSLFDLDAKYADVVSLDETLQYLDSLPGNKRSRTVRRGALDG